MKKFRDWLLKDWWLKILSIALSFVIWFAWIQIENPTDSKDFTNVRVTFTNREEFDNDNKVYEVLDNSDVVKVTVKAPKSVINSISVSDIVAEADVRKMVDGVIPISFGLANGSSYDSVVGNHDTVKLSIEDRARKYVRLETATEGTVSENHLYNGVTLDQNMIEISGPKSAVDSVRYAGVKINIEGASESISANMEILLYDANKNVINNSEISKQSDSVHVSVEILETKSVIVYASKIGTPAEGSVYTDVIKINPAQVTIAGTSKDLANVSKILITDSVDISGERQTVSQVFDLSKYLPNGIIFADSEYDGLAEVTVYIEQIAQKSVGITADRIEIINAPEGVNLEVAPLVGDIKVDIQGLQSELDNLSEDQIRAVIDVGSWMADSDITELNKQKYSMPVVVEIPGDIEATQIITVNVNVIPDEN